MNPIGTQVWVYDGEELEKVPCVYDLGEITRARHVRDRTSLSYRGERFELGDYESQDHQFIVKFDDAYIFERALSDKIYLQIYIGLSGSDVEPTVLSGELVPPEARKGFLLSGYVHAVGANINSGEFIGRTINFKEVEEAKESGVPPPPAKTHHIEINENINLHIVGTGGNNHEISAPPEHANLTLEIAGGMFEEVVVYSEINEAANLSLEIGGGELQQVVQQQDIDELADLTLGVAGGSLDDVVIPQEMNEHAQLELAVSGGVLDDTTIDI